MAVLCADARRGMICHVIDEADPTPVDDTYYRITVTNKTVQEVQDYLVDWRNIPSITQISFDPETNRRRILVSGGMVSVSGKNAFTRERFTVIQGNLSTDISPDPDPVYVTHTPDSFTFDLTIDKQNQALATSIIMHEYADMYQDSKRWRVKPSSLIWLRNNGGQISARASVILEHLQDGLLL